MPEIKLRQRRPGRGARLLARPQAESHRTNILRPPVLYLIALGRQTFGPHSGPHMQQLSLVLREMHPLNPLRLGGGLVERRLVATTGVHVGGAAEAMR